MTSTGRPPRRLSRSASQRRTEPANWDTPRQGFGYERDMADKTWNPNWDEPEYPKPSRRSKVIGLLLIALVAALMGGLLGFAISRGG